MNEFVFLSQTISLAWLAIALAITLGFSILLDRRAGIRFRDVLADIRRGNVAVAIYYGARWVGITVLVSAAIF